MVRKARYIIMLATIICSKQIEKHPNISGEGGRTYSLGGGVDGVLNGIHCEELCGLERLSCEVGCRCSRLFRMMREERIWTGERE